MKNIVARSAPYAIVKACESRPGMNKQKANSILMLKHRVMHELGYDIKDQILILAQPKISIFDSSVLSS